MTCIGPMFCTTAAGQCCGLLAEGNRGFLICPWIQNHVRLKLCIISADNVSKRDQLYFMVLDLCSIFSRQCDL